MDFWVGFNSNLATILPNFTNFLPITGFLTGVVLEFAWCGVLFESEVQITLINYMTTCYCIVIDEFFHYTQHVTTNKHNFLCNFDMTSC